MPFEKYDGLIKQGLIWCAEQSTKDRAISFLPSLDPKFTHHYFPFGLSEIDSTFPHPIFEEGSIHEWFSLIKPTGTCLTLLAKLISNGIISGGCNSSKLILWIGREVWPSPFLLARIAPDSKNLSNWFKQNIFLNPESEKLKLWSIEMGLRSSSVLGVIAKVKRLSLSHSKRLSLAAKKGGSIGFLLRDPLERNQSSTAKSRWEVSPFLSQEPSPCCNLQLLKCKGMPLSKRDWIIELKEEEEKRDEKISLRVLRREEFRENKIPTDQLKELGSPIFSIPKRYIASS